MFSFIFYCVFLLLLFASEQICLLISFRTGRRLPAAFAHTSQRQQRVHESEKKIAIITKRKRERVFCLACCLFGERKKRSWRRHSGRVLGFHIVNVMLKIPAESSPEPIFVRCIQWRLSCLFARTWMRLCVFGCMVVVQSNIYGMSYSNKNRTSKWVIWCLLLEQKSKRNGYGEVSA